MFEQGWVSWVGEAVQWSVFLVTARWDQRVRRQSVGRAVERSEKSNATHRWEWAGKGRAECRVAGRVGGRGVATARKGSPSARLSGREGTTLGPDRVTRDQMRECLAGRPAGMQGEPGRETTEGALVGRYRHGRCEGKDVHATHQDFCFQLRHERPPSVDNPIPVPLLASVRRCFPAPSDAHRKLVPHLPHLLPF